ncbi:glycosyltransferase [Granulicella arctica]|uniref:Glycosyltransferase involved in cell wall biosynthesis n=1 Tax=Granulicella arctica TaxID=940613 RepID=A0A7Y9PJI1_9BACT|nr:glycosyltransferase [Granulicella arctica]NYF80895.1 glycosyltransferase involved in cell wall biosynthesis [Granulicella arctica]
MRILHIVGTIDPKAGGVSAAIRYLVAYDSAEYDHEIVSMDDPTAPFLSRIGVPVHAFGPTSSAYAYSSKLVPWLVANRDHFDGVFVHGLWGYGSLAAWRAFRGHTPYAVFVHGMLDSYFKHAFPLKHLKKWLYWHLVEYWVLRNAYKVLFTGDVEARLAKESFWLHRWSPHVVALGTMAPEGDPEVLKEAFWSLCPQVRGRQFLLFLGRIHRKKGCDLLVDAFVKVAAENPGLDLVVAGPDQEEWQFELMTRVATAGMTDRVHWVGMLQGDAKWGAYFASEAFILPSHQENFGIAVAEALACGRPVLLSDKVNIAPDIAADGAGRMEPDTADGTLRLLEGWVQMTAEAREAMGQQALLTFVQRYTMQTNAKAITHIFETVKGASVASR